MTAQGFASTAALLHGVPVWAVFRTHIKWPEYVKARHDAWKLAYSAGWSYSRIAREFGADRSGIRKAVKK